LLCPEPCTGPPCWNVMMSAFDDLKGSFYLRVMHAGIGRALRDRYGRVSEPLPEQWTDLLKELDDPPAEGVGEKKKSETQ
jgi:hypothetical protein